MAATGLAFMVMVTWLEVEDNPELVQVTTATK
jgi:hypothetical protein